MVTSFLLLFMGVLIVILGIYFFTKDKDNISKLLLIIGILIFIIGCTTLFKYTLELLYFN